METTTSKILSYLKIAFWGVLVLQLISMFVIGTKQAVWRMQDTSSPHIGHMTVSGLIDDSTSYLKQLEHYAKNENIKALVIKIDSRGGTPASSQAVFQRIKMIAKSKPIVACVENICASGAYYIAAGSSAIFANPSSAIGSIGVVTEIPNVKRLMDVCNVQCDFIQSGKYKTMGAMTRDTTDEEKAHLQALSDDVYDQFLSDIAQARGIEYATSDEWADGKIFSGRQALSLGLVDQLGSMYDAVRQAKILAGIDPDYDMPIIPMAPKKLGLVAKLLQGENADDDQLVHVVSRCLAMISSIRLS